MGREEGTEGEREEEKEGERGGGGGGGRRGRGRGGRGRKRKRRKWKERKERVGTQSSFASVHQHMYTLLNGAMQAQQVDECVGVSLNTSLPYQPVNHCKVPRCRGVPTYSTLAIMHGLLVQGHGPHLPPICTRQQSCPQQTKHTPLHTTGGWAATGQRALNRNPALSIRLRALNRRPALCVTTYRALNSLHFLSGRRHACTFCQVEDMRISKWQNAAIPLSPQIIVKMRLTHLLFLLSLQLMLFALSLVLTC